MTSLRFRLAAINFLVTAVILCAMGAIILIARSREWHRDLDERLLDRAAAVIAELSSDEPGDQAPDNETHRHPLPLWPGYLIQVRSPDGQVAAQSPDLGGAALPLSDEARARIDRLGRVCETTSRLGKDREGEKLGDVRICTTARGDTGHRKVFVQVARSLEPVRANVRDLFHTMLVVVLFGMATAAVASWYVTGRMLRPLRAIARKADRLSVASLGERIGAGGRDEVAEVAASLDAMLDRLQSSFEAQERFLSIVSHELKTPLAVLLGQAQVLARQSRSPEEYERFITTVQDEARSLSRTVESLLTLAKAEAGFPQVSKSPVSVNEVTMNAVTRCAPLADHREVKLATTLAMPRERHPEPIIDGDAELLGLMISNLIRNAIRYAPPDSAVDVQVVAEDNRVEIAIRDRGPGIPDEFIDRVFDRFFQVPKDAGAFHGSGLGLTIARGVAELHGGGITVRNLPDAGCEFCIGLPLAAPPPNAR